MHLREIRRLTNDFLKQAEVQETPIYGQQPTTKKEKQREYYYLRLQFLDVRLQTLTEEMDLQAQKNQIEVDQKTPAELTMQECDQIIATMTQELKKLPRKTCTKRTCKTLRTRRKWKTANTSTHKD